MHSLAMTRLKVCRANPAWSSSKCGAFGKLALRLGGCLVTPHESHALSSLKPLCLSEAKQLWVGLHKQEADFTGFNETLDLEAVSRKMEADRG